jgi:hypothetical protein
MRHNSHDYKQEHEPRYVRLLVGTDSMKKTFIACFLIAFVMVRNTTVSVVVLKCGFVPSVTAVL